MNRERWFHLVEVNALILAAGLIASCAHSQVWVASGESIDALGKTFLATGRAIDTAHTAGTVTDEQYAKWRAFSNYFKVAFDFAAERWLQADDVASEHAAPVLAELASELAGFTALGRAASR